MPACENEVNLQQEENGTAQFYGRCGKSKEYLGHTVIGLTVAGRALIIKVSQRERWLLSCLPHLDPLGSV